MDALRPRSDATCQARRLLRLLAQPETAPLDRELKRLAQHAPEAQPGVGLEAERWDLLYGIAESLRQSANRTVGRDAPLLPRHEVCLVLLSHLAAGGPGRCVALRPAGLHDPLSRTRRSGALGAPHRTEART